MNTVLQNPTEVTDPTGGRQLAAEAPSQRPPRVLVVDDNEVSQLVTLQQLRQLDCVSCTASSGVAALEAIIDERFDLILLDCRMPELDGYTTARAIRKVEASCGKPRVPIVAITCDRDIECVDKCFSAGMDGHVTKPTSLAGLRIVLERFVP